MESFNSTTSPTGSPISDLIDENESADECENTDACSSFEKSYGIECEEAVSLQSVYVLHLDACFQDASVKLISGLSDYRCIVYDISTYLTATFSSIVHEDVITDVKIVAEGEQKFYTGSLDGTIKLWDLRTPASPALIFKDDSDGDANLKPISCFDVSSDQKFVCGGTPLVEADSYLLFWDSRKSSVLGGYWETHTDDVTQVKFSARQPNLMLSSSTDGLVNLFDVSHSNEDDALQNSFNVDAAVRKLRWFDQERTFGCITDMETVQMWQADDAEPTQQFDRQTLGKAIELKSWKNAYACDIYAASVDDALILSGSNVGKGDYLKLAKLADGELNPYATFEKNKQLVRCSCYDARHDKFITAGESGVISVWKAEEYTGEKMSLKERTKKKRSHLST